MILNRGMWGSPVYSFAEVIYEKETTCSAAGVITGVAVTQWPSLTRVIRAEAMQVRFARAN